MKTFLFCSFLALLCVTVFVWSISTHLENTTIITCIRKDSTYGSCTLLKTNSLGDIPELEFIFLQGNETVQIKKVAREDETETPKDSFLQQQYKLELLATDKAYSLSNYPYGRVDELEAKRKKISDFLIGKEEILLNLVVERVPRTRFYTAFISIFGLAIVLAVIFFQQFICPAHLESKRQNLILAGKNKQISCSNEQLSERVNKLEESSQELSYECKKCLDEEDRQKNELETLKTRKNDLLKKLRNLNVVLNHYEEKFGTKISISGDMTASTINLGKIHGDVQSMINNLEQSDNPKKPQSKKRSK